MKQLSGKYSEIELVKNDSTKRKNNRGTEYSLQLNSSEWNETLQKLAAFSADAAIAAGVSPAKSHVATALNSKNASDSYESLPIGKVSPLQEDETRYYATAVINKTNDR